jgi:Phospholipase_D-nuclease N-terminal
MDNTQILLLVLPIALIEIGLIIFALRDLVRPERRVRGDSKLMWGIIVVLFGFLGPILYFVVGREQE